MAMEVEFDPGKARSNFRKHGVTFEQAFTALRDERANWIEDPDAEGETRWLVWGMSERGILLAVAITFRGDLFRIISARKATRNEARFYAKRIRPF